MALDNISPRAFDIPHDEFRPGQYELLRNILDNRGKFVVVSAPTGTGKSALAKGLGSQSKVLVLVHTLNLLTQYETGYGFSVVRGRQEYPCVNEEKIFTWMKHYNFKPSAAECHFKPMWECPYSGDCPYLIAKNNAMSAQYSACTYRYAGLSSKMKERGGHLVMDEAHDAAEEIIGFNSHTISEKELFHLDLPEFPIKSFGPEGKGAVITDETRGEIVACLEGYMDELAPRIDETKEGADAQKSFDKYGRIIPSLFECDWFLRINDGYTELLSLSAMHIAQKIFEHKDTKLLMSATIGNPDPLTNVLGINDYEFFEAPHPTPPMYRKIKDLHMDRMTHRNLTRNKEFPFIQAQLIWRWIQGFPEEWRGLIVSSSFQKINWLNKNLQLFNNGKRRFIVQGDDMNVSEAVEKFISDVQPGDIMIGTIQGMGSGLDLYGDLARWVVIAGVPHENPTDYYAKARRDQYGGIEYQYWNIFMQIVQAAGRVARGEKDEAGNWLPNFCALADGSTTSPTAMRYYPAWFKEAIK